jgi:hypothetical protein
VAAAYDRLGLTLAEGRKDVERWASAHRPKMLGVHEFSLAEFGLDASTVRDHFAAYLERFALPD